MCEISVDADALGRLKEYMVEEGADAIRIFIAGGGCCRWVEVAAVRGALAGDVRYDVGGVTLYVERALVEGVSRLRIHLDEGKGLCMDVIE
jgi:Fe-S cluster assembly iron-binding protein IscA